MSVSLFYRALLVSNQDAMEWAGPEATIVTNWPEDTELWGIRVDSWKGQVVVVPAMKPVDAPAG